MPDFTREESWVKHVDDLSAKQSATTVGKYYPHEMVEKLIKAVFFAGYRAGDSDAAVETFDPDDNWIGIKNKIDIFSPEAWENVP